MGIATLHPSYISFSRQHLTLIKLHHATLRSESKQISFTALSIAWSLVLAWLVSFVFYQGARALGY